LKSPLVSLSGYIGYLIEDYGDRLGAEGKQFVERMTANAKYMEDLIQDLLELSRIGRMQTELADVDVQALVRDIASELHSVYPEAVVEAGDAPTIVMNPVRAR